MTDKKYTKKDYQKRILNETGVVIKRGNGPTLEEWMKQQKKNKKRSKR